MATLALPAPRGDRKHSDLAALSAARQLSSDRGGHGYAEVVHNICHPGQAMRRHRAEPGPIVRLLRGSRRSLRSAGMTVIFSTNTGRFKQSYCHGS